jgi:hypothetical protein
MRELKTGYDLYYEVQDSLLGKRKPTTELSVRAKRALERQSRSKCEVKPIKKSVAKK